MKNFIKFAFLLPGAWLLLTGCSSGKAIAQAADDTPVTYQIFYDNLIAYGTWIDYPQYGLVWSPRISGNFRPYATNGYWIFSTWGWTWISGYPWGWATFHYGCWLYDDAYGWLWIPGYEWSPAWVTWGFFDSYYCWAPLMPGVFLGPAYSSWRPHSFYWNACRRDRIYDGHPPIEQPKAGNTERIAVINNFGPTASHDQFYAKGPEVREVQQYVHQRIDTVIFRDADKVGKGKREGNTMDMYRPVLRSPGETSKRYPQRVFQPRSFRKAEPVQSFPVNNETQRPVRQSKEQRTNVERLPVQRRDR